VEAREPLTEVDQVISLGRQLKSGWEKIWLQVAMPWDVTDLQGFSILREFGNGK
jgi:hypothetical protein